MIRAVLGRFTLALVAGLVGGYLTERALQWEERKLAQLRSPQEPPRPQVVSE